MQPDASQSVAHVFVPKFAGYTSVAIELLARAETAPVDIFLAPDQAAPPKLYCRTGIALDQQQVLSLEDIGIRDFYVQSGDVRRLGEYLRDAFLNGRRTATVAEQFSAMQVVVAAEVEHAARLLDCSKYVHLAATIGSDIAAFVSSRKVLPYELFTVARHDFNTFVHVTNVASYSVLLAKRLGINEIHQLELLASAAMLHDLGKRHIPSNILNKTGRLTTSERELVELHPTRGYTELCSRPDLTFEQLMVVYQHHERVDGTGYPVGIPDQEICFWAKLLAVVDVFDALTGERPYRAPITPQQAIEYLQRNAGTHFDAEIVQCWEAAFRE